MELYQQAKALQNYMSDIRRYLHRHPELSLREYETAALIRAELDKLGVPYTEVQDTGVLGRIHGTQGEGRRVLLRADIDALPIQEVAGHEYKSKNEGVMHACGHDVHTAALLGAAKLLVEARDSFAGEVLLVFQPAEEKGSGSRYFLKKGVLPGYDRAFGIHVSPEYPAGHVAMTAGADAAAVDYFKIVISGKSAHISKPEAGQDALQAAAKLAGALKAIPTRLVNPLQTALVGVGTLQAGTAYNVIAGEAALEGTVRSLDNDIQSALKREIERLAPMVAAEFGCDAGVEFEFFCSAIHNNGTAYTEAKAVAEAVLGPAKVHTDVPVPLGLAGDDFAEYLKNTKGVYAHVGVADKRRPTTCRPLHSNDFDVDENALPVAAALHAGYALYVLGADGGPVDKDTEVRR